MAKTAIQLYTVRELDEPLPAVLERVADAGYDGVEFAYRLHEADLEAVAETLADTGLEAAGAHAGLDLLREDLDVTAETYHDLGCERLVLPHLDALHFEDEHAVAETATELADLTVDVGDAGFEFHYHNHTQEFTDLGERTAWELLVDETTGVGFELDVGWARAAGQDPAALIREHGDRTPLLHVTDVDGDGEAVAVGDGVVDHGAVSAAAADADAKWLIYENDNPGDPAEEIRLGAEALDALYDR